MKNSSHALSPRAIVCGAMSGGLCFLSRTLFGTPLEMIHLTDNINLLPPFWLFNLLSISACFLMGMSFGWIIDYAIRGYNSGTREVLAYRGALFLSFAFFMFLLWFPVLFYAQRLFISFLLSVVSLICSLACAIGWSRLSPMRASVVIYADTIWLFYIMLVSLSVWWGN